VLALEEELVLALEHLQQQALLAAEVVVHEREAHAGLVGDGTRTGRGMAALEQDLARRVDDPPPRRLPPHGPPVGIRHVRGA
jgi:hypothetical protein